MNKDNMFEKIASNFKKTRQEIKLLATAALRDSNGAAILTSKPTHVIQPMRDLILTTSTSIDLKNEGRENITIKNKRYSHSSVGAAQPFKSRAQSFSARSENSRYSYTSYGSRVSL